MNDIVIREKKGKVIGDIIMGIFITLLSIYVLVVGLVRLKVFLIIFGVLGTILFGSALIFIIKGVINKRPVLIIREDGILDMSTLSSIGLIPWEHIKSLKIQRMFSIRFIGIDVYDLDKILNGASLLARLNIKFSLLLKYPPLSINVNTADIELNTLLLLIQEKLEEYRAR